MITYTIEHQQFNDFGMKKKTSESIMEILTFTGLSCSGKTFLMESLRTTSPDKFGQPIGITTRQPRVGEIPGADYIFLSKEEFEKLIEEKKLVAHVVYHDHYYGTRVEDILKLNEQGIIAMVPSAPDMVYAIKELHGDNVHLNSLYLNTPLEDINDRLKLRHFKEQHDWLQANPASNNKEKSDFFSKNMSIYDVRFGGIVHDSKYWPRGLIEEWEGTDKHIKYNFFLSKEDLRLVNEKEINDLYHKIKLIKNNPKQSLEKSMPSPTFKKPVRIIAIVGRSASGKSTLANELKAEYGLKEATSFTSRKARKGEVNGVAYHFVSQSEFAKRVADGEFVEHVEFNNHSYGLHRDEVMKIATEGKPVLAVVEPNGLNQIANYVYKQNMKALNDPTLPPWEVSAVWLNAPDDVLLTRLADRALADYKDATSTKEKQKVLITLGERWLSSNSVEREWELEARKEKDYVEYPQKLADPMEIPTYFNMVEMNIEAIDGALKDKATATNSSSVRDLLKSFAAHWISERFEEEDVKTALVKFDAPMEYDYRFERFDDTLDKNIMKKVVQMIGVSLKEEENFTEEDRDDYQSKAMINASKKSRMP